MQVAFPNITKGKLKPGIAIGLVGIHVGAIIGIVYGVMYGFPLWTIAFAIGMGMASMFGVSLSYHRYYTHRSYKCNKLVELMLLVKASFSIEGTAREWTTNHTQHHAYVDRAGDPHSPWTYTNPDGSWCWKGFWWAHIGWLFFEVNRPDGYIGPVHLKNYPLIAWQEKYNWLLILLSFLIPFYFCGWPGLWLAGFIRVVVHWHFTWSVNSVTHLWGTPAPAQYREASDRSRNNVLVALGTVGEGYHGYHHAKPNCAYLGWSWYDFDPGKWVLVLLAWLNAVWNVNTPSGLRYIRPAIYSNT